jgi:heat shock protein HslJ
MYEKPRRRWFRFGLLALFALIAAAGVLASLWNPFSKPSTMAGEWKVVMIGKETVPVGVKAPTLSVTADGKVSGFAGVNHYVGALAKDGDKLFGGLGRTLIYGFAAQEMEEAFIKALVSVTRFSMQNDTLTLFAGDEARLVLSKIP